MHILIKFSQGQDVFICSFVDTIKLVHQRLFKLYYDIFTNYEDPTFDDFNSLFILSNDTFPMNWFFNLNGGKEKIVSCILICWRQVHYITNHQDGFIGLEPVTKDAFNKVATKVNDECEKGNLTSCCKT